MILVDASVWVDHIDHRMDAMDELLDAYQVITFSRTADYLFPGGFQPYRGEESLPCCTLIPCGQVCNALHGGDSSLRSAPFRMTSEVQ